MLQLIYTAAMNHLAKVIFAVLLPSIGFAQKPACRMVYGSETVFDENPAHHPEKPKRQRGERKEEFRRRVHQWSLRVFEWMKRQNDPNGLVDNAVAVGFQFQADGAVLNLTGHSGTFQTIRNVVLSTLRFEGKMYDFPGVGDVAVWKEHTVEIRHADGRLSSQNGLRSGIEEKSRKIIKKMVKDAIDGRKIKMEWQWTQHEVLYFLFYAFREYIVAPNPTNFLQHARAFEIEPKSDQWAYKITLETKMAHTHSAVQDMYLDRQGRIGRIRYNFDLMDGKKDLMPVSHDIGGYIVTKDGIPMPTIRRASIRWDKFSKGIRRLAEDKADDMLGGFLGPLAMFAAPFAAPIVDGISSDVVDSVKDAFYSSSDFGMKGDLHGEIHLYNNESEIP